MRAVRRSFLCGESRFTGMNFDHPNQWLEHKLRRLSEIFAIEFSADSILVNHYHVIVHVDEARAYQWDAAKVKKRWHRLFKDRKRSQAFSRGDV